MADKEKQEQAEALDKLQDSCKKVVILLKERQTGHMSWWMFLNERSQEIAACFKALGMGATCPNYQRKL